jgi:psiF repeat
VLEGRRRSARDTARKKKCNADANAKALKGDDPKTFMGDCLKADKKT